MVKVSNMGTNEFGQRLKTEKIVCICAGRRLKILCEAYPLLQERISYVVDNYCHGKSIVVGSREMPILSMQEIGENIREATVVITSLRYAGEIIRQMDNMDVCDGLEVFIPDLFHPDKDGVELKSGHKQMIPKVINYCWFGGGDIPEKFQKNIESWRRVCPEYEIVRWDESNYDYKKNRYMLQAYEAKKWGFVPDFARLDIINAYGGIYLDVDVELLKPFDDFLEFDLFCGFENPWFVALGLGFGGIAQNPILQEMMELYEEIAFIRADGELDLTASPVYQTEVLARHGLIRNGCSQEHDGFAVFAPEFFAPINAYGYGNITQKTCSIHQYAATWFGDEHKEFKERVRESIRFLMGRGI